VRITVLAVGKLKPPFADDVRHYQKLLGGHARLELIELRDNDKVEGRIPNRAHIVLLDSGGKTFSSEELAKWLEDRRQSGMDLCFIVGGPRGLSLERCDTKLSFGPMTLPHQMARVVLLEQLYRAHKILAGEPYHY
jgi:23S rRNA (pseudouridine1915-N3)-methyltransferase